MAVDGPPLPFSDEESCAYGSLSAIAPNVSTPITVFRRIASMAGLTPDDRLVDLGCGDGDLLVYAAEHYGVHGQGWDILPEALARARDKAAERGVAERVEFLQRDFLQQRSWVKWGTVVYVYLTPRCLSHPFLREALTEFLRGGGGRRVVAYHYFPQLDVGCECALDEQLKICVWRARESEEGLCRQ